MKFNKALIFALCLGAMAEANIPQKLPASLMVLNEFNIDHNYINNRNFQNFVEENEQKYRRIYMSALNRADLIVPTIKEMLIQNNMSPMFLYVSLVESSFKPGAVSRSKAKGLWQFKKGAGQDEKLMMNYQVDERLDPIRSTEAAISYLKKQNSRFGGKWYLAAMAYNFGGENLKKSILRAGTDDLNVLMDPRKRYVRDETRDYINKILLFAMIGENYLFDHRDNMGAMMPTSLDDKLVKVRVRKGTSVLQVASVLGINANRLKNANLHLKNGKVLNSNVGINIPESKWQLFYDRFR